MAVGRQGSRVAHSTWLAGLCLCAGPLCAVEIGLTGTMGQKAMLVINGASPRLVGAGQTVDGVTVVSVDSGQVVVDAEGRRRTLRMGTQTITASAGSENQKVILTADVRGHFSTQGTINGTSVTFLVDTGATLISLGSADAARIGIDTRQGEKIVTQTANGQVAATRVKLNTVRVGDITLHQVDAIVHDKPLPFALLGMSFLNRTQMQRDGSTMTLTKRF